MFDNARGGNDTLIGGNGAFNTLYGDADAMHDNARGGNDTLIAGDSSDNDPRGRRPHHGWPQPRRQRHADRRHRVRRPSSGMSLVGDAFEMHDNSRGGNDHLTGGTGVRNVFLFGDANIMDGDSRGGNDTLTGAESGIVSNNFICYGDAQEMHDTARGGDDTLTGGASQLNLMYGDAGIMDGHSRGGNDTLIGGVPSSIFGFTGATTLIGDAEAMSGNARGGNDTLIGADGVGSSLFGDAGGMGGPPQLPAVWLATAAAATTR